jgi:hypothetical protein
MLLAADHAFCAHTTDVRGRGSAEPRHHHTATGQWPQGTPEVRKLDAHLRKSVWRQLELLDAIGAESEESTAAPSVEDSSKGRLLEREVLTDRIPAWRPRGHPPVSRTLPRLPTTARMSRYEQSRSAGNECHTAAQRYSHTRRPSSAAGDSANSICFGDLRAGFVEPLTQSLPASSLVTHHTGGWTQMQRATDALQTRGAHLESTQVIIVAVGMPSDMECCAVTVTRTGSVCMGSTASQQRRSTPRR